MGKKNIIIVLTLFILTIIGIVGYYLVLIQKQTKPETLRDEFLNWKTYKNYDFNFEIKYPENMIFVEDTLEDIKQTRMQLYHTDKWYEIAAVTFYEKYASGEFADRFIIGVLNLPITGGQEEPFTSLDDYINYRKQLLSNDKDLKNINFMRFSINGLEFVKEMYEASTIQSPLAPLGVSKITLYSLYDNGLIYTFILGSNDSRLLNTYEAMMKSFRFIAPQQ